MNSVSHLNGSSDLRCLSLINRGRSAALCGDSSRSLTRGWRLDASGSAASRFWSICLRFRMRCKLKTAPNIGELSLFSAIGPNGMSRCSRWPGDRGPPRPLGPMHSVTLFPPRRPCSWASRESPYVLSPARSRSVIRFDGQICDLFELFRETATLKCYGESQTALGLAYLLSKILSNRFSYRPS